MEIIGVAEGVLKHLRVHIITGKFEPGQKLNEINLSSSLGISRAPIREAFRILENENLVVSVPRKGCFVTNLSFKDCQDIYRVRTMMECFAVDILQSLEIRHLPEVAQTLEITANLRRPDENDAYQKFDYLRAIADFHIRLVETAGNLRLNQLYGRVFPSLARYQSLYTYIPGLMGTSQQEHEEILRLIKNGSYPKAKELLGNHIKKFIFLIKGNIPGVKDDTTE